jgi:hypothetical protein
VWYAELCQVDTSKAPRAHSQQLRRARVGVDGDALVRVGCEIHVDEGVHVVTLPCSRAALAFRLRGRVCAGGVAWMGVGVVLDRVERLTDGVAQRREKLVIYLEDWFRLEAQQLVSLAYWLRPECPQRSSEQIQT